MMTEAVEDLTTTLNEAASAAGVVSGMVDSISQAINQVRVLGRLWALRRPWARVPEHSGRGPDHLPHFPILPPQLDEGPMGEPEGSFVDYQTTMVRTAKAIAVTVQEMVSVREYKRTALGELSLGITSHLFHYS